MRTGVIFLNDPTEKLFEAEITLNNPNSNCLSIEGLPAQAGGFKLIYLKNGNEYDYSNFSTIYKVEDDIVYYSNNGSVYIEPELYIPKITFKAGIAGALEGELEQRVSNYSKIKIPTITPAENYEFIGWKPELPQKGIIEKDITYIAQYRYEAPPVPIEELKEGKINSFNAIQQQMINEGTDIELTSGVVEHFTATEADQRSLAALQAQVMLGSEAIPWHTSNQLEGCKYYSNEDMKRIIEGVTSYVTYHVTYFRDLRKIILLSEDRDFIESIEYGMLIPEEYQSDVLKDIYASLAEEQEV